MPYIPIAKAKGFTAGFGKNLKIFAKISNLTLEYFTTKTHIIR